MAEDEAARRTRARRHDPLPILLISVSAGAPTAAAAVTTHANTTQVNYQPRYRAEEYAKEVKEAERERRNRAGDRGGPAYVCSKSCVCVCVCLVFVAWV